MCESIAGDLLDPVECTTGSLLRINLNKFKIWGSFGEKYRNYKVDLKYRLFSWARITVDDIDPALP